MTSFVRFACPFAFRFVRRVLGGLLSSCYVLVSYCVFRRRGFVRSFRVSLAFRFVRSVLGGLLSSCSFLSSSCPILGPKSSGGTSLSLFCGVFFVHKSITSKSCHMPLQSVTCSNSSAWSSLSKTLKMYLRIQFRRNLQYVFGKKSGTRIKRIFTEITKRKNKKQGVSFSFCLDKTYQP